MSTRDETLEIRVGDHRIAGTMIVPDALMPGVLFLHGWGGNQTQYATRAREIAALGCACLTVDLRGHAGTAREQASCGGSSQVERGRDPDLDVRRVPRIVVQGRAGNRTTDKLPKLVRLSAEGFGSL